MPVTNAITIVTITGGMILLAYKAMNEGYNLKASGMGCSIELDKKESA